MLVDVRAEFDFLDSRDGVLAFLFLLGQLVAVFAVIDDAADGRLGVCRDFDEVEAVALRFGDGLVGAQDAELGAGGCDNDADFAGADALVDAVFGFALVATMEGSWFNRNTLVGLRNRVREIRQIHARAAGLHGNPFPWSESASLLFQEIAHTDGERKVQKRRLERKWKIACGNFLFRAAAGLVRTCLYRGSLLPWPDVFSPPPPAETRTGSRWSGVCCCRDGMGG
jgi:hypothetical protein